MSSYIFSFINAVNKSLLQYGIQTIPTRFNDQINQFKLCSLHESVGFNVFLPNNLLVKGKIRRGWNNSVEYYQLSLPDYGNALGVLVTLREKLEYHVDLENKVIRISKNQANQTNAG